MSQLTLKAILESNSRGHKESDYNVGTESNDTMLSYDEAVRYVEDEGYSLDVAADDFANEIIDDFEDLADEDEMFSLNQLKAWVKSLHQIKLDWESSRIETESVSSESPVAQVVEELNEYLADNHHRDRVYECTDGRIICEIEYGDWKHEHLWFQKLVKSFFEERGESCNISKMITQESEDDTYSATYYITTDTIKSKVESTKVESYEPLVKRVSFAFDAQVPVDYTEEGLEDALKLALETKGILVDSYVEIHTQS